MIIQNDELDSAVRNKLFGSSNKLMLAEILFPLLIILVGVLGLFSILME